MIDTRSNDERFEFKSKELRKWKESDGDESTENFLQQRSLSGLRPITFQWLLFIKRQAWIGLITAMIQ